jgi:hypothetical protein
MDQDYAALVRRDVTQLEACLTCRPLGCTLNREQLSIRTKDFGGESTSDIIVLLVNEVKEEGD